MLKKTMIALTAILTICSVAKAQDLSKFQWYNQPAQWSVKGSSFSMTVTPKTDYWRQTGYGFTDDDAPFYYGNYGGEFEVKAKLTGHYESLFDQMGLMVRVDEHNWIKTGIEFVGGKQNISVVVTHKTSDWSIITLDTPPASIWIKIVRRLDALYIYYSFDNADYKMMRMCYLQKNTPVMVGMMGASPEGKGFKADFDNFEVKPLPDQRRTEWDAQQAKK